MILCDLCESKTAFRHWMSFRIEDVNNRSDVRSATGYEIHLCVPCLKLIDDMCDGANGSLFLHELLKKLLDPK